MAFTVKFLRTYCIKKDQVQYFSYMHSELGRFHYFYPVLA